MRTGRTRLQSTWRNMKRRCYDKNSVGFKYYGERGIKVCDDWLNNFENFYNWAMANGYADNLTIERKDVNLGYSPQNCTWIELRLQGKNTRKIQYVIIDNEKLKVCDIFKRQIPIYRIQDRINAGWPKKYILDEQYYKYSVNSYLIFNNEIKTKAEWARIINISIPALNNRIKANNGIFDEQCFSMQYN